MAANGWSRGRRVLHAALGVTPIVIGLTVVALGALAPQLLVSVVLSIKA